MQAKQASPVKQGLTQKVMLNDAPENASPETPEAKEITSYLRPQLTEQTPPTSEGIDSSVTENQAPTPVAALVEDAAETELLTSSMFIEDSAAEAIANLVEEATEVEGMASSLTTSAPAQTSEPTIQEATAALGIPSSPLQTQNAIKSSAPSAAEAVEEQVSPQSFPGPFADEERMAKTFLGFYGLNEQPFGVTPDPAYLYLSEAHQEALISLSQGVQDLRGFMALVAEPGMGKTTLLNKLMEELRNSARIVFLFQSQCNSRELLRYILGELGVQHAGMDLVAMHRALNEFLFQAMLEGRRFVLIVDEAQNLQDSTLETIRLLSDFETSHAKLLQIVLAGQPQLAAKLTRPHLSQLRQRIAVLAHLEQLAEAETARYIEHRLAVAGCTEPIFTPEALALIAEHSQGIPRNINNICCNALLKGYAQECKTIGREIVEQVVAKLDVSSLVRRSRKQQAAVKPAVPALNIAVPAAASVPATPAPEAITALSAPSVPAAPPAQLALPVTAAPLAIVQIMNSSQPLRVAEEEADEKQDATVENQSATKPVQETEAKVRGSLTGKLTELVRSRPWGKDDKEYRLQISLEREPSSDLPVADRYYCCSFYVSEEEAATFRTGRPIRIKFEQD